MVRVDVKRNRQLLVDAAIVAFSAGDEKVTLEAIAKRAGVGIGTLYRHFPTREDLVEAVYRDELATVCATADDLLTTHAPAEALRAWMDRYADFVATKRGMAEALRAAIASGAITATQTRERLAEPIRAMLEAGIADGTLRADVRAEDVVASLAGIMLAASGTDRRQQAGRMLDLLVAGVRTDPG